MSRIFLFFLLTAAVIPAFAQILPPPSRTVYKCEDGKKTFYSDSPCLGAKKIDVEPTRGLNKASGKEVTGNDVQRERTRDQFASAIKPVTGMDAKDLDRFGRRSRLSEQARQECQKLDVDIPAAERTERAATDPLSLKTAQMRLFMLRNRFHEGRCD